MRSKEFIQDSVLDNMVAQVKQPAPAQPKLPYNQSKVGNWLGGQVGKNSPPPTTLVGKLAQGAANAVSPTNLVNKATGAVSGLGNALGAGIGKSLTGGYSFGAGVGGGTVAGGIPFKDGQIDPKVADYLKKAAKGQPLKQNTGNTEFDAMLKNAGLLK
jgi:hypothetical protein